ncbi:hypothetical protein IMG5_130310 [Ichthyophthirius multifiliis]|uniref:Uncharacterized protein n=1 Tax=Ichthyophthirius multifiliis TaxID=5932 RepID=G0QW94_ICHMU|nr:hypothetical protein IMG5_130310 [Ichthyophthirius multifiliis]EGR30517.1 hypothetical protein IMG5_130310 [Ichthyophthirius multifiliis]|eukprot:XP_004032104.1 hypothetical protein IMG5_130310 [Ichthyophthirius multifiliis]
MNTSSNLFPIFSCTLAQSPISSIDLWVILSLICVNFSQGISFMKIHSILNKPNHLHSSFQQVNDSFFKKEVFNYATPNNFLELLTLNSKQKGTFSPFSSKFLLKISLFFYVEVHMPYFIAL